MSLLEVRDLKKHFPIRTGVFKRTTGHVYAVDGVSFDVEKGETMGLVGESGGGKSTVGRTILRLTEATAGGVTFEDIDVMKASRSEMNVLRRDMQIVFQDPYASLNPRMRVRDIVGEALKIHDIGTVADRKKRVAELLEIVGLTAEHAERYPHEFSGGQRQRIGIARALALNPKLIILDEPVSALDVSIRAQVLNLLEDLQDEFDLTYLFVSHDLSVVKHISDRVAVLYLGKLVEISDSAVLYELPAAPVHGGAPLGRAHPRPSHRTVAPPHHPRGRRAESGEPSRGMRLPPALPQGAGDLHHGDAASGLDRRRRRPSRSRLLLPGALQGWRAHRGREAVPGRETGRGGLRSRKRSWRPFRRNRMMRTLTSMRCLSLGARRVRGGCSPVRRGRMRPRRRRRRTSVRLGERRPCGGDRRRLAGARR